VSNIKHILVKLAFTKKTQIFRVLVFLLVSFLVGFSLMSQNAYVPQVKASDPWPDSPPAEICSNSSVLDGPTSAPSGAVTVAAGDNSAVNFSTADTTYYFAAGTHTLGSGAFSQIQPGNGSTFIGAPGAVLDGQNVNKYAFVGSNSNVTIKYLTIQHFNPGQNEGAVNQNANSDWTVEYNTIQNNTPGAGIMIGTNNNVSYNCITENGQLGFDAYTTTDVDSLTGGPSNITLNNNEISYNDTYNWESVQPGCGCTGGGKFWRVHNATVDNNYVHNNYNAGLWADTDNDGFQIENNYISDNFGVGIWYEISYNALIQNNNFVNNAWGAGANNPGFPTSAIYL